MKFLPLVVIGLCMVLMTTASEDDLSTLERETIEELEGLLGIRRLMAAQMMNKVDQVDSKISKIPVGVSPVKPEKPLIPSKTCCNYASMDVFLNQPKPWSYTADDSNIVVEMLKQQNSQQSKCSGMAVIKATFDQLDECMSGCVKKPQCGRRMLKVQLELDAKENRGGHMLNVGDSVSNNGHAGDSNHQRCDAEVHTVYPNTYVYASDECGSALMHTLAGVMKDAIKYVTLYVSNEHIRVTNDFGMDFSFCSKCLFCLNGQDFETNVNYDVYIGLNRVVSQSSGRTGTGICKATASWECPCEF